MFLDFYKLREQPFGVTPDPRYLYPSPTHREALATLLYGVQCGRGFMSLIARPGMGKTTVLYCLLDRLRDTGRTAFLFQTQSSSIDLFRQLLADLGIGNDSHDPVTMHQQLNEFLVREAESRHQVVVVIDEAQNLDDEVLESVRLLSNFETPRAKLMQIILAGQPPLADKLASPSLSQLRQRLSFMAHLKPFSRNETERYIDHRLRVAGYSGNPLFTPEARRLIALLSQGNPRVINHLCFNALSIGCATHKATLDGSIVREAAADLDIAALGSQGTETPVSHQILRGEFSTALHGSEGPVNDGAHPRTPAAESKSSLQTRPGGAPPQAVPEVLPGLVSRSKGNGAMRWALRAATISACFIVLCLIPSRIMGPYNPRSAPATPAPRVLDVLPLAEVRTPVLADYPVVAVAKPANTHAERAPKTPLALRHESSAAVTSLAAPRPAAGPANGEQGSLLSLETIPPGVVVHIDGEDRGRTPIDVVLAPGVHTYRLELEGYAPFEKTLESKPGVIYHRKVAFLVKSALKSGDDKGTVDIRTDPPGAEISVDGVARGTTPADLQMAAGDHRLEINLPGYQAADETIAAKPGQTLELHRVLSPQ